MHYQEDGKKLACQVPSTPEISVVLLVLKCIAGGLLNQMSATRQCMQTL